MNLLRLTIPFFIVLSLCSCKNQNSVEDPILDHFEIKETPKSFVEEVDYGSIGRKGSGNIIDRLFKEAINEDEHLKGLSEQYEAIMNMRKDSLTAYNAYKNSVENYFQIANHYTDRISDSTLKIQTQNTFKAYEADFQKEIQGFTDKQRSHFHSKEALEDHFTLLELAVTYPMLRTFINEEKPSLEPIENAIEDIEVLTQEIKKSTPDLP